METNKIIECQTRLIEDICSGDLRFEFIQLATEGYIELELALYPEEYKDMK